MAAPTLTQKLALGSSLALLLGIYAPRPKTTHEPALEEQSSYSESINYNSSLARQKQIRATNGQTLRQYIDSGSMTIGDLLKFGYEGKTPLGNIERRPVTWEGRTMALSWENLPNSSETGQPVEAVYRGNSIAFHQQYRTERAEEIQSGLLHETTHDLDANPDNATPLPDGLAPQNGLEKEYGADTVRAFKLTSGNINSVLNKDQRYFFRRTELKAFLHEYLVDNYFENGAFPRSKTELWASIATNFRPVELPPAIFNTLENTAAGQAACKKFGAIGSRQVQLSGFDSEWHKTVDKLSPAQKEQWWNTILPNATAELYNDVGAKNGRAALMLSEGADPQGARDYKRFLRYSSIYVTDTPADLAARIVKIGPSFAGQLAGSCGEIFVPGSKTATSNVWQRITKEVGGYTRGAPDAQATAALRQSCVAAFEKNYPESMQLWEARIAANPTEVKKWRDTMGKSFLVIPSHEKTSVPLPANKNVMNKRAY